jgi:hypothetical protein
MRIKVNYLRQLIKEGLIKEAKMGLTPELLAQMEKLGIDPSTLQDSPAIGDAAAMMFGEPDVKTPEDMITAYTAHAQKAWKKEGGSRQEYLNMAAGGGEFGMRQEYYSKGGSGPGGAWSDQDFQQVIDAVDAELGTR